ncbi:hypothetical protein GCM10022221_55900 [Actinocorallia aurea]
MSRRPKPPPGQGPAVVWTGRGPRAYGTAFAGAVALAAVLLTLSTGDLAWVANPLVWCAVVVLAGVVALIAWSRKATMSAGNEWFRSGSSWVRVSKLTRVKFAPSPRPTLHLEDTAGRDLTVDLLALSAHPDLSAHLATTLRAAAPDLSLDPQTAEYLNSL